MKKRAPKAARHLPARRPPSYRTRTQFGQLMELLARRHSTPRAAFDGSPVGFWHGFPVEEAVTNGLWLVIQDLARKEGRDVEASEEVAAIAGRVDTLVNAGLSAGFPHVEAAADAFARKVVEPVARAARLGFRPGDPPTMSVWKELAAGRPASPPASKGSATTPAEGDIAAFLGRPAALFFARVVNGAVRYRSRLEARLAELERFNALQGPLSWIPDSDFQFARRAIRRLVVHPDRAAPSTGRGARPAGHREGWHWGAGLETARDLEACRERIARCRRWPVRIKAVPRGMLRISVEEGWLDTVVLMSIGRAKGDSDILSLPQFWKAVSLFGETCRGEKGTGPLHARILRMLVARDPGMDARTRSELSDGIESSMVKLDAAFDAFEELAAGMASHHKEMGELSSRIRTRGTKLAGTAKGRESIREARDEAADRLARLQQLEDQAKSEFRANHFPAIFLPESSPEEALTAGGFR